MPQRHTHVTIDHDEIRRWAKERDARPVFVRGTGIIRLDLPGYAGEDRLRPIGWDEWLRSFDENDLALLYQEETARGVKSNFNKLVSRESIDLKTGEKIAPPRRRRREAAGARRAPAAAAARTTRATGKRAKPTGGKKAAPRRKTAAKRAAPKRPAKAPAQKKRREVEMETWGC